MNRQSKIKIFAHRGASSIYPENTMSAFYQALADGADGIELDVHLTYDQQLVVIHDETIDRTSNGHGTVEQMTLQQLRKYNYYGRFKDKYPDQWFEIPTLEDVLKFLSTNHLICNIELKTDTIHYPQIEEKVIALVDKYQLQHRIIYSSFNIQSLVIVHQINSQLNTALLTDTIENILQKLDTSHAKGLHLDYRAYHSSLEYLSCPIRLWTINHCDVLSTYLALPIDTIMTDYPKLGVNILNDGGHESETQ